MENNNNKPIQPKEGYILVPYIIAEHSEESLKDYHEFMAVYKKAHEVCPKCGSTSHSTTFMGYIMDSSKRDEYKDLNNCVCSECKDLHTMHDRIGNEEFLQKEIDSFEIEKEVMVSQTLDLLDSLDVFQNLTDTQLDKMKISLERIWENGFRAGKIKNK